MNVKHLREDISIQPKGGVSSTKGIVMLNIIFFILFSAYAITPYWLYNPSIIVLVGILGFWVITFLLVVPARFSYYMESKVNIALFFLVLCWVPYVFILRYIGFSTSNWGNFFVYALFWYSYVVFCFYDKLITIRDKRKIVISVVLLYIINTIDNIRLLIVFPSGNKLINFYETYKQYNIGGTTFAFELALCALICQFLLINNFKYKKPVLALYVLNAIYLFVYSGKMTTIILFLWASLIMMIFNKTSNLHKNERFLLYIGCIVAVPLLLFMLPGLFRLISDNLSSVELKMRLLSLADFLSNLYRGNMLIDEYLLRIDLARLSLETFFSSPIVGIGKHFAEQMKYGVNAVFLIGIGSHSELIDHLAVYGLIGFFSYIILFKKYISILSEKCVKNSNRGLYKIILVFVVLYSILNNSFSIGVGILLFIILPFAIDIVEEETS